MIPQTDERTVLEQIAINLEAKGFQVFVEPSKDILPAFLRGFAPDAIALSKEQNLLIEVAKEGASSRGKIERLKELLQGQKGWELKLYLISPRTAASSVEVQSRAEIEEGIRTVEALLTEGRTGPALLMAWATFEALCRAIMPDRFFRPQTPGRLVEEMAAHGYLEPSDADRVRLLIAHRNGLIHGKLTTSVSSLEVGAFVSIMRALLKEDLFK